MKLEDLVGRHFLSGVDNTQEDIPQYYGSYSTVNVVRFVLDGVTYKAVEDPDDGYRSYLGEIGESTEPVTYNFPPQVVDCRMKCNVVTEDYWDTEINNTLQMVDSVTGKVVLEIGTDNTDDYYPYCVMNWYPENLAINRNIVN